MLKARCATVGFTTKCTAYGVLMSILIATAKTRALGALSLGLTVMGPASQQIASLVIALAAAAILSVADFGTYALAIVFVEAGILLIYTGFHHFITVDGEDESVLLPTCLCLMVGISAAFGLVLFCLAPSLAVWFESPELSLLLQVLSILQPAAGVIGWCSAVLLRKGATTTYFAGLLFSNAASVFIGVLGLLVWPSVFALLAYRVVRICIGLAVFLWAVPVKPKLGFNRSLAIRAFAFARSLYAARFLGYFGNFGADLVLAALFTTAESGLYRFANRLASASVDVVALPIKTLAQSRFGQAAREGAGLQGRFEVFVIYLALFGGGAVATVTLLAESAVADLFRPEYLPAAALVGYLACRSILMAIGDLTEPVFAALKKTKISLYYSLISTFLTLTAITLTAPFGVGSMVVALSVGGLVSTVAAVGLILRHTDLKIRSLLVPLFKIVVALSGFAFALGGILDSVDLDFVGQLIVAICLALFTTLFAALIGALPGFGLPRGTSFKNPSLPDVPRRVVRQRPM